MQIIILCRHQEPRWPRTRHDMHNVATSYTISQKKMSYVALTGRLDVKVRPRHNAVVTPLRKTASYEQRKTNLGNQNFGAVSSRSAT